MNWPFAFVFYRCQRNWSVVPHLPSTNVFENDPGYTFAQLLFLCSVVLNSTTTFDALLVICADKHLESK